MKKSQANTGGIVTLFFLFMLLHQTDKLLIGPLTTSIMETFKINTAQMGAVSTGALIVGAIFYPLWGYASDRFSRSKLLALAAFIWGSTTWLNALAPTFSSFLITRSSTGIDDSSYPGLYSLTSDLFPPQVRGKIYGLLQITSPLGYLIGTIAGLTLGGALGWRNVFLITGGLGILLSVLLFTFLKDPPRGQAEPEMAGQEQIGVYRFEWSTARALLRKPSLIFLFLQGFFGVFPWNAITYWFFVYLETERRYSTNMVMITMVVAVLVLAAGYPLGGAIGDFLFKRTPRGRLIVATTGVVLGAILLVITLSIPDEQTTLFLVMLSLTALCIPLASPNATSTLYDITLPEVRSTAMAVQSFIESIGSAVAPLLVGVIAYAFSLKIAFLIICTITWVFCALFFVLAALRIEPDIRAMHQELYQRAMQDLTAAGQTPAGSV